LEETGREDRQRQCSSQADGRREHTAQTPTTEKGNYPRRHREMLQKTFEKGTTFSIQMAISIVER